MNTKHFFLVSIAVLEITSKGYGQSALFQDLNFENANIVPIAGQPYAVTTANALPGWTVDYASVPQTQITYNDPSLGGTAATLIATGYPPGGYNATDGDFSILLYGGPTPISISQTGLIPAGTQSLLFDGAWFPGGPDPTVSIDSEVLTLFPVQSGVYGANISAWSGETEELSFTVPAVGGPYIFDDISFSPNPITITPEPSPIVLTAIGGVLFALYRRFVKS